MMGFVPDENDSEFLMSASNEIMNQMMGHASNKLGNDLGIFIDISTPDSHVIEKSDIEGGKEISFLKEDDLSYIYTTFKLNVNDQFTIDLAKVLDSDFIPELREIMHTNNYIKNDDSGNTEQEKNDTEVKEVVTEETTPSTNTQNNVEQPMYDTMQQPMQQPMYDTMQQPMQQPMQQQPMYQQPMYQQPIYDTMQPQSKNIVFDESVDVKPYTLPNLTPTFSSNTTTASSNRIKSVEVELTVELGRTRMTVKDILDLDKGSIIELNRLAGVTNSYINYIYKS